jgi:hypothetical protein
MGGVTEKRFHLQFEASVTRFDNLAQGISVPERGPGF